MNKLYIIITFLMSLNYLQAQESVFIKQNSSGGYFANANGRIETTVGEIYANLEMKNGEGLSSYFLQPLEKVIVSTKDVDMNIIHISPNPVSNYFEIKNDAFLAIKKYKITSNIGAIVQENGYENGQQIDVSNFPNGTYFATIYSENNVLLRTFKFIKIN